MEIRPSIFLYTDEAQITEDVRSEMVKAGYLPVRVASVDSVRILTAPFVVDATELSAITTAALTAIVDGGYDSVRARFGHALAKVLLRTVSAAS